MSRTTADLVKGVLVRNYDGSTDLTPFIDMAYALTTRVEACAIDKGLALTDTELEIVERWLSAHFYQAGPDKGYASRSTAGASASFQGQTGKGLESTDYGQQALLFDPSGCLRQLTMGSIARGVWLGKRTQEQSSYRQRNQ